MFAFFLAALNIEEEELDTIVRTTNENAPIPTQVSSEGGEIDVVLRDARVLFGYEVTEVSLGLLLVTITTVGETTFVGGRQTAPHHMAAATTDGESLAGTVFSVGRKTRGAKEVASTPGTG